MEKLVQYGRRGVELVSVILFTIMFGAFVLQVFSRYVLNAPLVWTLEACLLSFLWLSFWNCGLLLKVNEHIGFTLFYDSARPSYRRALAIIGTLLLGGVFLAALPGTVDWVAFMGIGTTDVFELRLDLTFSIFVVFMIAVIIRSAYRMRGLVSRDWSKWL